MNNHNEVCLICRSSNVITDSESGEIVCSKCCQRRRILIVDDELDIAFTFEMVLEENGFNKQVDTYNEPLSASLYPLSNQFFNTDPYTS